jgi:hypothetical protein
VIATVTVAPAGVALLLDVIDFTAGRHLAVFANHATAGERRETEKPNETHHTYRNLSNSCTRRVIASGSSIIDGAYRASGAEMQLFLHIFSGSSVVWIAIASVE